MGIMARKMGELFVITSDRLPEELPCKLAPKLSRAFRVWTGNDWSTAMADAQTFRTADVADEYVRSNYAQVMG